MEQNWSNCLCGHGIKQKYYLRNDVTGALDYVGNSCVKQFMRHLDAPDAMFSSIRRVRQDPSRKLHRRVLSLAVDTGRITGCELIAYNEGQRREVNLRILAEQVSTTVPKRSSPLARCFGVAVQRHTSTSIGQWPKGKKVKRKRMRQTTLC